ncbi:MAG: sugar transferase [Candidatus Rokuibacteriota bacterium]
MSIRRTASGGLKRLFDVAAAGLALVALAPLMAVIAALVKLDSPGPVFYRQRRVGKDQRLFEIYKFRTMVDGASRIGPAITVAEDRRVTRIGRLLRRLELDELPTFLNVLKGDMSIVGPRPEVPRYLPHYGDAEKRVFTVRPGITDPGTLRFRDEGRILATAADAEAAYLETVLPEKLRLNLEYLDRRGFWYDVELVFRTVALIVRQPKW